MADDAVAIGRPVILDNTLTGNEGGGILLNQAGGNPLIRGNTIADNQIFGIAVQGAAGTPNIQDNAISSTDPRFDGKWGDGIFVALSEVWVTEAHITTSARAGLSNFGGVVHLADSDISCSAFDLEGEFYFGNNFQFDDQNGNHCGCPTANQGCISVTVGLSPPEAVNLDP